MLAFNRLSAGALALAAGAVPASADNTAQVPKEACAFVGQIDNFKEIDDFSAIIETSPNRRYKVTFFNNCRQMRWALFARVEARPGICLSRGDQIVVGRLGSSDRCTIETIEALPPAPRAMPATTR